MRQLIRHARVMSRMCLLKVQSLEFEVCYDLLGRVGLAIPGEGLEPEPRFFL